MTNYAVTLYDTEPEMEAAVEALATTVTHKCVPYKEECDTKFMVIVPAPNAYTP